MRELPRSAAAGTATRAAAGSEGDSEAEDEDPLAVLLDGELPSAEPSDLSSGTACSVPLLDVHRLAGAMAAAGVLQPPAAPGSSSASSGGGSSGGEGGSPAAADCQRLLAACDDIGCLAAVTLRFMHQPG